MSDIFLIGDTHFSHRNILKYSRQVFLSHDNYQLYRNGVPNDQIYVTIEEVERHNQELINNWNSVVKDDDVVYHLGDFSFGHNSRSAEIFPQLNGTKILIRGNHDTRFTVNRLGWEHVYQTTSLRYDDYWFELVHNPEHATGCRDCVIHGHTHSSAILSCNGVCVCAEAIEFRPIMLHDLYQYIKGCLS
ncbi:MAG: metallophosphoesterase family protein [Clostridia bacterium]|jgi:calcineurin-like phosphoesterase family protein